MDYVIVYNDRVIWGPMNWRQSFFEKVIKNETELSFSLPSNAPEFLILNENLRILPVVDGDTPAINQKIQQYAGPFWEFINEQELVTNTVIVMVDIDGVMTPQEQQIESLVDHFKARRTYTAVDRSLGDVMGILKAAVAANRYNAEVSGTTMTLQGQTVSVYTNREDRSVYLQAYQLGSNNASWKFPEGFFTLSNSELGLIVQTVMGHVQTCFDWESTKVAEIEACTTLTELDLVSVEYGV